MKSFYKVENNELVIIDKYLDLHITCPFKLPSFSDEDLAIKENFKIILKKDEKKNVIEKFFEKNKMIHGEYLTFYENGSLKSKNFYYKNFLHGPSIYYSKDNKILSESWFCYGKRQGKMNKFYKNGKIYSNESYKDDNFHKEQKYFYENGSLKSCLNYFEGVLDGEVILFWPNKMKKRQIFFKKGKRENFDRIWNEKGVLIDEAEYENNSPVNRHFRYTDDGKLFEEIYYYNPNLYDRKVYDENSEIILETKFDGQNTVIEKSFDNFLGKWISKTGVWDGKQVRY